MTKPMRSPLLGYNHNIRHLGRVFHVQTEDSGPANPRLFTHLFFEGTILVSRREQYEPATPDDSVRALMKAQHKSIIRDLSHGTFDERIVLFFQARGEIVSPGAVPLAPMPETPPPGSPRDGEVQDPAMAAPPAAGSPASSPVPVPLVPLVPLGSGAPAAPAAPARAVMSGTSSRVVPPSAPAPPEGRVRTKRSVTLPVDTTRAGGAVTVRPPNVRRPPFVRSGSPVVARTSSADGVVVQRSVVVNGPPPMVKAARIRPPVPYVVGGGVAPAQPTPSPRPAVTVASPVQTPGATTPGASPPPVAAPPSQAPVSAVEASGGRGFGDGVRDDKSLDEVILEYLSESDDENDAG